LHQVESPVSFRKNLKNTFTFEVNHTNKDNQRDTKGIINLASKRFSKSPLAILM